jgi:protein-S-isoprenylcysteine O-methyltransferase Ste14
MGATKIEFRLRMLINAAIIILGFWAPWIELWGIGKRTSTLEWLGLEISRAGLLRFTVATPVVIIVAALVAGCAVIMRVWGTAYLGPSTVNSANMRAGGVMADGPYRHLRNPLYFGVWLMVAAMSFLMPPTGAPVAMTLVAVFILRLILGEEAFLSAQLGETYREYLQVVPRIIPQVRTTLPSTGAKPQWLRAFLVELTPIGIFLALAVFSWNYDHQLMIRVIIISSGISLLTKALVPDARRTEQGIRIRKNQ